MPPQTIIEWPNREKSSSKLTRVLVVAALLVSTILIGIVTVKGWDLLQDAKSIQVVFMAVNVIFIVQVLRWSRGVLPMAAGLATFIGIFALVSIDGWYARDQNGFNEASLSADLGFVTILILIAQIVVIVVSIIGFSQNWQTEVEHEVGPGDDTLRSNPGNGQPLPA